MPTYDYECTECGYTFEHFQAMSEAPLETCPECGGKVRRLIGGGLGIIFKGSGFYVTDNKKKSSTQVPSKKESAADQSASTGKKSEKKKDTGSSPTGKAKKEKVAT